MKVFTLLWILLIPVKIYCQERTDESMPFIINRVAIIDQATGWIKNDLGKWVSAKNYIPAYKHDFGSITNQFNSYILYKVNIEGNDFTVLIRTEKYFYRYFVIDISEKKELTDSVYFIGKNLICSGMHSIGLKFDETDLLNRIKVECKNIQAGTYTGNFLYVAIKWFPSKKIFRFNFDDYFKTEEDPLMNKYFEVTDITFRKFIEELL